VERVRLVSELASMAMEVRAAGAMAALEVEAD
jgi:hypothetical protein